MKKVLTLFFIAFCFSINVKADIIEFGEEKIFFAPDKVQKNVSWSKGFSLKETGLETEHLAENTSQDVWLQTHAFPIGLSWRPPNNASFFVSFAGETTEARIYIRYSCDKINWSTWYEFSKTDKKTNEGFDQYKSEISIPYSQNKYQLLMREWWKTKPIWSSDETEFCEWLLKKQPDFFEKEFPFIGYVQVLAEFNSVRDPQKLKLLKIGYSWGVGGIQSIPEDASKVRQNIEDKWFFEGKAK